MTKKKIKGTESTQALSQELDPDYHQVCSKQNKKTNQDILVQCYQHIVSMGINYLRRINTVQSKLKSELNKTCMLRTTVYCLTTVTG